MNKSIRAIAQALGNTLGQHNNLENVLKKKDTSDILTTRHLARKTTDLKVLILIFLQYFYSISIVTFTWLCMGYVLYKHVIVVMKKFFVCRHLVNTFGRIFQCHCFVKLLKL